jgi:ADP-ribose pyrophosphatase YjhB (NUDIX family)
LRRVALVAASRDGLILFGKRDDNGRWTLPGGHVEDGEAWEDGARRELKEETGLEPEDEMDLLKIHQRDEDFEIRIYGCTVKGVPTGDNDPDAECRLWAFLDVSEGIPKAVAENMAGPKDMAGNVAAAEFGLEKAEQLQKAPHADSAWAPADAERYLSEARDFRPEEHLGTHEVVPGYFLHHYKGLPSSVNNHTFLVTTDPQPIHANPRPHAARFSGYVNHPVAPGFAVDTSVVHPEHQKRGLGEAVYRHLLSKYGQVHSGGSQSPEAQAFWHALSQAPDLDVKMGKPGSYERHKMLAKSWHNDGPRGFVDPTGGWHQVGDEEDHHDWIARQFKTKGDAAYSHAMKQGWMGVGVAGDHNVQAAKHILNDPNHPATKAVREIAKKHWGPEFEAMTHDFSKPDLSFEQYEGSNVHDTASFVHQGRLAPPNPFRKHDLVKMMPGPRFPKMGFHDDRRETPIVTAGPELNNKAKLMAARMTDRIEAGVPVEQRNPEARAGTVEHFRRDNLNNNGAVLTSGTTIAFSKDNASRKRYGNVLSDQIHDHPNAPVATREHENFHLMMNRVQARHGQQGRAILARNLFNSISPSARVALQTFFHARPIMKPSHPLYHEEMLAHLLNYLNNGGERTAFHQHMKFNDALANTFSSSMKQAHRDLFAAGQQADDSWALADRPPVKAQGLTPPPAAARPQPRPRPSSSAQLDMFKAESLSKMAMIHDDESSPMIVHRIQNAAGEGPYSRNAPAAVVVAGRKHYYNKLKSGAPDPQPVPHRDFPEHEHEQLVLANQDEEDGGNPFRFAFEKPEHASEWFGPEAMDVMKQHGYTLQQVPAARVYRSNSGRQLMYLPAGNLAKTEENDEIDRMLMHPSPSERRMALKLGGVKGAHLVRAFRDEDPGVQRQALNHPSLDHYALHSLMQMPDREHLQLLALSHPHLGPEHLDDLYETHRHNPNNLDILHAISHHPDLDEPLIDKMMEDGNGHEVIENLKMPPAWLERVVEDHQLHPWDMDKKAMARRALRHPSIPMHLVERAFKESPMDVRVSIAESQHLPEALAHDVMMGGQLPGNDHEAALRHAIVSNPVASKRHLETGAKDRNSIVRQAASKQLGTFQKAASEWMAEALYKATRPEDFKSMAIDRGGSIHVDHAQEYGNHPGVHNHGVQVYRQHVIDGKDEAEFAQHRLGGVTSKVVYQLPDHHPTHAGHRFMVKPYHEKWKFGGNILPIHGWSEMTNQALYHAGGIGHLHQPVHVEKHDMGGVQREEPALVVHMADDMNTLGDDRISQRVNGHTSLDPQLKHQARQVGMMDFLTGNSDRHQGNLLVGGHAPDPESGDNRPTKLMAIDHGLGFQYSTRSSRENDAKKLVEYMHGLHDLAPLYGEESDQTKQDWAPVFDWWSQNRDKIKQAMNERLKMIKRPIVRAHLQNNFMERGKWLDKIADQGLDRQGNYWHNEPVNVTAPSDIAMNDAHAKLYEKPSAEAIEDAWRKWVG